jgi:hypothetical protein
VLVVSGVQTNASPCCSQSAELFDPVAITWSLAANPLVPRQQHTATLLPAVGKVLIVGGLIDSYSTITSSAELYDPATDTWSPAASLSIGRRLHTATLLSDGKVLVTGGYNGTGAEASAELYDPITNTWSSAGNLQTGRDGHAATLLPNGNVLVSGGHGGGYLASCELYDPVANTWTVADSMLVKRAEHTATLLQNGAVLAAAGGTQGASQYNTGTAELYWFH